MRTPEADAVGELFDSLAFGANPFYHHQGWLSGRVTTDDNFTHHRGRVFRYARDYGEHSDFPVYSGK